MSRHAHCVSIALALLGFLGPCDDLEATTTNLAPTMAPWDKAISSRFGAGYNSNLLLSDRFRESSPLLFGRLEATVWRLPIDGPELFFIGNGEYIQYLPDRTLDNEQLAYLIAVGRQQIGQDWRAGLQLQSIYQSTVVDASATETILVPLPVKGYLLGVTPEIRRDLGKGWSTTIEGGARRQWYDGGLDHYSEYGPRIIGRWEYARRSNMQISYKYAFRTYDTRLAFDEQRTPIPGRGLTYQLHEVAFSNTHTFDNRRRWRLTSRCSAARNVDNGSGYWDFTKYQLSERLRFAASGFTVEGHANVAFYDYPRQTSTGAPGASRRYMALIELGVRLEKSLGRHLNAFAEYAHNWNVSNRSINEYDAGRVKAGMEWHF